MLHHSSPKISARVSFILQRRQTLTINLSLHSMYVLSTLNEKCFRVGRPFRNEACNWYNINYPSAKFDIILRKFSK